MAKSVTTQVVNALQQLPEAGDALTAIHSLLSCDLSTPFPFNWVSDVFESVCAVKGGQTALLLVDENLEIKSKLSFSEVLCLTNQLLNLLQSFDIQPQSNIYTILPIDTAVWVSYLAAIKGGYLHTPTATLLTNKDLSFRFTSLPPTVVISDLVRFW
jgi:acyl-coenzyme A synthetase/AMP-(fatty) acid ligase